MKDKVPELTPGGKIYQLFGHSKVYVIGREEAFVIRIRKVDKASLSPPKDKVT